MPIADFAFPRSTRYPMDIPILWISHGYLDIQSGISKFRYPLDGHLDISSISVGYPSRILRTSGGHLVKVLLVGILNFKINFSHISFSNNFIIDYFYFMHSCLHSIYFLNKNFVLIVHPGWK